MLKEVCFLMKPSTQDLSPGNASSVGLKVLLVDDDPSLLRLHQIMLQNFLAVPFVTCVDNALDAMLQLERETPDLVIVDLNMPGIDGFNLLNLLENDARYASVAKVVLSGLNAREVRHQGSLPPDVVVIQKPLDARKMQQIQTHLAKQQQRNSDSPLLSGPAQASALPAQANGHSLTSRKKVLVIDDNPDIRKLLNITLSAEFHVLEAGDAESGLHALFQHHPELVFLDIMLQGELNGLQLLEMIRADPVHRRTWVGMISARGQKTDYVAGQAYGADAYFVKPFSPQQLLDWCRSKLA
jgi:DNA-binding response OmpR family regulator